MNTANSFDDPLCIALRHFMHRDLMDAADHLMDGAGWSPITVALAHRLRDLDVRFQLWPDEPDLIRSVLDGVSGTSDDRTGWVTAVEHLFRDRGRDGQAPLR
jgi:hypothetical protein